MPCRLAALLILASSAAVAEAPRAPMRFAHLLEPAVHDGLLTPAKAEQLEREWANVTIGQLPVDAAIEESLVHLSAERGWLPPEMASKLAARAAPVVADPNDTAVSWLNRFAALLPWIGGLALAIGGIGLAITWLRKSSPWLQAAASAAVTGGLFWATDRVAAAAWPTVSEILAMSVAAGTLFTLLLICDAAALKGSGRAFALGISLAWAAEACRFGSSVVAGASAVAASCWIHAPAALAVVFKARNSTQRGRLLALTGAVLLLLGYFSLLSASHLSPSLTTLVRPYWLTGLTALMAAVGLSWDWEEWLSPSQLWTLLLGGTCVAWGVAVGEGLFIAVGELALLASAYVMLFRIVKRFSWSARVLVAGGMTLGIATGLDRYWGQVVGLLTLRSF